jgi:hypothetical protein
MRTIGTEAEVWRDPVCDKPNSNNCLPRGQDQSQPPTHRLHCTYTTAGLVADDDDEDEFLFISRVRRAVPYRHLRQGRHVTGAVEYERE